MFKTMKAMFQEESGQGMVEYGLIIAVVALVVVVGLSALGGDLSTMFTNIKAKFAAAA